MCGNFQEILEAFGFEWDGNISFQSARIDRYRDALERLEGAGLTYACRCSRSELAAAALADPGAEPVYPGTCRYDATSGAGPHALRFAIPDGQAAVEFDDAFQGRVHQDCRLEAGDFVIRRRDGLAAYHLAVVLDDADSGVTEVIRGADLLASTPRQILLQRALGLESPQYGHLPLLTEPDGRKLAKSRRSLPASAEGASRQLWQVLEWLGQGPPAALRAAPVRQLWEWAIPNWRPGQVAGRREIRLTA